MKDPSDEPIESLVRLGFNRLEAVVYTYLVEHPPGTGYKIARGTGKTNANTYKALDALLAKGAVEVDEGDSRVWRAVPPNELLAQLRRRFDAAERTADRALGQLTPQEADDRIYRLQGREQVFERARQMLASGQLIVLLDLYPTLVETLREPICQAVERGVQVTLKAYAPADLPGATVVERRDGGSITEVMRTDHLSINVDGRAFLTAHFEKAGGPPIRAIWTASPIMAYEAYGSLIYELILTDVQQAIWDGGDNETLRAVLARHEHLHPVRNRNEILRGFLAALGHELEA